MPLPGLGIEASPDGAAHPPASHANASDNTSSGRVRELPPERGCVEDQPQQLPPRDVFGFVSRRDALDPLRLVLRTQPRSARRTRWQCPDEPISSETMG